MTIGVEMRKLMMVWPLGLLALVAGCADAGADDVSSSPTSSASPSSSPSETAVTTPNPTAPSASPEAESAPPQCGDAYVVELNTSPLNPLSQLPFEGTDAEVLAQAAPRGDFVAPELLDGLIVSCVVTMYSPVDAPPNADGSERVSEVSVALVGLDNVDGPAPLAHFDGWRVANGYLPPGGDIAGIPVYSQPLAADGTQTRTIYFGGLDPSESTQLSALTEVEIDAFGAFVILTDFTFAQP